MKVRLIDAWTKESRVDLDEQTVRSIFAQLPLELQQKLEVKENRDGSWSLWRVWN